MQRFDLTHARHDYIHCLAPGLFRSTRGVNSKSEKLDVVYEFGNGNRIEFSGPEVLGVTELRVLQGLVAMAGPMATSFELPAKSVSSEGANLREMLELRWDAAHQNAIAVKGSLRQLAKEIGFSNTRDTNTIRNSIEKLWKVSIISEINGHRSGFRLLANYNSNSRDGSLYVALNPLIANAVLGYGRYVHVSMDEVREIKNDVTRLIHQWMCGWMDIGKKNKVSLDTVINIIYPDSGLPSTMGKRRSRVRSAVYELAEIGWGVGEYARGKFEIMRPR
ncbi:replication protein C, IncQ-type [Oceanimonas smirnovii]|uniref:replication protein C, IncQ-type n=1 Tax=Oceanimonas smirnovii TaxID=264574 RepID=UPI003AB05D8C